MKNVVALNFVLTAYRQNKEKVENTAKRMFAILAHGCSSKIRFEADVATEQPDFGVCANGRRNHRRQTTKFLLRRDFYILSNGLETFQVQQW